jgi:hypothetical protein
MELFNNIEYVDADKDYDKFCKINKDNERRKALSAFFVNLMKNEIITATDLKALLCNLMRQLVEFIKEDNKKNIVDELTENIALLYSKTLFDEEEQDEYLIDGSPILETITKLANSKVKMYVNGIKALRGSVTVNGTTTVTYVKSNNKDYEIQPNDIVEFVYFY